MVLIPALNPPKNLVDYVEELIEKGIGDILIVDDGSNGKSQYIFEKLSSLEEVEVLRNAKNLGKGRSLKNAFNYFLTMSNIEDYEGIVTADSDGQHRVEDVIAMKEAINQYPNSLILGCRDFDSDNVPPKSKFGNKLTKSVIKGLYGRKITDTQTGLRGFPKNIILDMIDISGERFEYETRMLIHTFEKNIPIDEITIETIYYDNNAETHFNPIKDSLKIYKVIFGSFFKYLLSSLSSFIVDIVFFQLFLLMFIGFGLTRGTVVITIATVIARIISSTFNFYINKNMVFNGEKRVRKTIVKYYSLCVVQMILSALLVSVVWHLLGGSETIIKICVDTVLFFVSYQVQRRWVFKYGEN